MTLKVTKIKGFTLSLENTFLGKLWSTNYYRKLLTSPTFFRVNGFNLIEIFLLF